MPLVKIHKLEDPEDTLDGTLQSQSRIEELSDLDAVIDGFGADDDDDDGWESDTVPSPGKLRRKQSLKPQHSMPLPRYLQTATLDLFRDSMDTTTSQAQKKVTDKCLPLLLGKQTQLPLNSQGLPHLRRRAHSAFLHASVSSLPTPFQVVDSSRPWLFLWAFSGLSALDEPVLGFRERLEQTLQPLQNATGGFGGGYGQYSHAACSYGSVSALAIVGGLRMVDRKAMWHWLGQVKQADGGFRMAVNAEEDIRGAYCAMVIVTLLNLPLILPADAPARKQGLTSLLDGLGDWISRCQTYEGGIAGAPSNEAHGAYAFCALACLSILDAPHTSIPAHLDVRALRAWLAARQTQPEGGFQGRQEKLVDACYSHWVGACFDLLDAAERISRKLKSTWGRGALIRYLLTCCQQPGGTKAGMRDKPSTKPDAYHTCYSLAGLSHAQNHYHYDGSRPSMDASGRLTASFNWTAELPTQDEMAEWGIEKEDLVGFVHPVFGIGMEAVERARVEFEQGGL